MRCLSLVVLSFALLIGCHQTQKDDEVLQPPPTTSEQPPTPIESSPAKQQRDSFDGAWMVILTELSKTDDRLKIDDSLLFKEGQMVSRTFAQENFMPTSYTVEEDSLQSFFRAQQKNDSGEVLQWSGFSGGTGGITGTMTRVSSNGKKQEFVIDGYRYDSVASPNEGTWILTLLPEEHSKKDWQGPAEDTLVLREGEFSSQWTRSHGFKNSAFIILQGAMAPNTFQATQQKETGEKIIWRGYTEEGKRLQGNAHWLKTDGNSIEFKFSGKKG
jgi:hypothetical protein